MIGCKHIGYFRGLSNYRKPLIHALHEKKKKKKSPSLYMMHINPIKCPTRAKISLNPMGPTTKISLKLVRPTNKSTTY